jgi:hypothetical protein
MPHHSRTRAVAAACCITVAVGGMQGTVTSVTGGAAGKSDRAGGPGALSGGCEPRCAGWGRRLGKICRPQRCTQVPDPELACSLPRVGQHSAGSLQCPVPIACASVHGALCVNSVLQHHHHYCQRAFAFEQQFKLAAPALRAFISALACARMVHHRMLHTSAHACCPVLALDVIGWRSHSRALHKLTTVWLFASRSLTSSISAGSASPAPLPLLAHPKPAAQEERLSNSWGHTPDTEDLGPSRATHGSHSMPLQCGIATGSSSASDKAAVAPNISCAPSPSASMPPAAHLGQGILASNQEGGLGVASAPAHATSGALILGALYESAANWEVRSANSSSNTNDLISSLASRYQAADQLLRSMRA